MSRPVLLLLCLLICGAVAGWWLAARKNTVSVSEPYPAMKRLKHEVADSETRQAAAASMRPVPETAAVISAPNDDAPDYNGIAIELVRERELRSLPLTSSSVPRPVVERLIADWLARQFPGDYGKREGRALAALGAIPEAVDTVALRAAFWSHQIGAWYDAAVERLALVEKPPEAEDVRENALGLAFGGIFCEHGAELFSANGEKISQDAWLARMGLIAGDAAFTRLRHALAHPRTGGGGGAGEDPDDPSRAIPLPAFLRERDLAAFGVGMDFVKTLHGLGKYDQVNAAYGRPPVATLELLEPSLYLEDKQFKVEPVAWTDVTVGGINPLWDDTMGAVGIVLFLRQQVAQPLAAETAAGWRGDRLLVYPSGNGARDHAVWQTLWRDSNAADAFFTAMRLSLLNRYRTARANEHAPDGVLEFEDSGRSLILSRTQDGHGVMLIDAALSRFAEEASRKFSLAKKSHDKD